MDELQAENAQLQSALTGLQSEVAQVCAGPTLPMPVAPKNSCRVARDRDHRSRLGKSAGLYSLATLATQPTMTAWPYMALFLGQWGECLEWHVFEWVRRVFPAVQRVKC